jgi:outer membrane lipoprotein SlyB
MMWVAGIAVTLFSVMGIAAIMGWIPTSMGESGNSIPLSTPGKHSSVTSNPATARTPASHPAPAIVASNTPAVPKCADCGVIESTRAFDKVGEGSGIGAVGGAVAGGLLGHQVGAGRGKTVATVVGAVGGAVAGNEVEKRVKTDKGYEVTVRLDDGSSRVVNQSTAPSWRTGDHVRVVDGVIHSNP